MVKYFSVDWLAQSYHNPALTEDRGGAMNNAPTCRPHIPCMVQPRPPTYGKGYLQPKLKPSKPVAHTDPVESSGNQDCSLLHPTSCASPISEMSEYSSGYESETASSECLSLDEESKVEEEEEEAPKRRVRTKFTPEQINKLEKIFSRHKYLEAGKRLKTAQKLNLTETQVRSWFQNRRMKLKRELQDYLAPQLPAVMFQPLPPVLYHSIAGHPPHYPSTGPAFCPPLHIPQMVLQQNMAHQNPPHLMLYNQHFY